MNQTENRPIEPSTKTMEEMQRETTSKSSLELPMKLPADSSWASQLPPLLESLYGRINYERQTKVTPQQFRLQNMRDFLRRLGDPHLKYPIVHVAGTKGKGSVVTMIGNILLSSNRRTGVYVSPHLETINQRISLAGMPISNDALAETLATIAPVAAEMDEKAARLGQRSLTFFEVITAAAFYFFWKQKAEVVLLEVGLGGRMDSTNVCLPVVSVITNISFDHTRQLGNSLEKIAGEKAGIIKPGVQVISGVTSSRRRETTAFNEQAAEVSRRLLHKKGRKNDLENPRPDCPTEPADVIAKVAKVEVAPLAVLGKDFSVHHNGQQNENQNETFTVSGAVSTFEFEVTDLKLGMIGAHQRNNAALAVAVAQSLNQQGWQISDSQIREGLAGARIAGRTEIVSRQPLVILDIAHNVASVAALVDTVERMPEWKSASRKILLLSISEEKDVVGMLPPLLKSFDQIVFTKYQNNPRGIPAVELLELAQSQLDGIKLTIAPELTVQPDPEAAWQSLRDSATPDDFICVAGSAFLIAEVRPLAVMPVS